jgi:hypothetical protein
VTAQESTAPDSPGSSGGTSISVRLVMPDRWLEHVVELPVDTTVAEAKLIGLEAMLLRTIDEPEAYYAEYAEHEVHDESATLESLGIRPGEILSIRAFDLGHYPRFRG